MVCFLHRMKLLVACVCYLLFTMTGCGSGSFDLKLTSPLNYQVFQRQTRQNGILTVAGSSITPIDSMEVKISGMSISGPLPDVWQSISVNKSANTFHADILTPAGGFYTVVVRKTNKVLVSETSVAHVGVGEVFVVSGQSNSTNYGESRQIAQSNMVTALGPKGWQIANDPQPDVQDGSDGGSFIPSFGDAMYKRYGVPIGVASVGRGGTSVRQWLPKGTPVEVMPSYQAYIYYSQSGDVLSDGELYSYMHTQIARLGRNGFRALLWHQGESDSNQPEGHNITGDTYQKMMEKLISSEQADADWDFPWFVAKATYNSPTDPSCPPIQMAQQELWQNGPALQGPDTDQLMMQYRSDKGQGTHFNGAGLRLHGQLWAESVSRYLDNQLR